MLRLALCGNDLLESISVVDRRVLEEIERTVLTPQARRTAIAAAEKWVEHGIEHAHDEATQLREALACVSREIENLLRAIEAGEAPACLLARLHEREDERANLQRRLASTTIQPRSQLDRHRIRRVLPEGLSRLDDVLSSEPALTRQALSTLLAGKVRFTPVDLGD